MKQKIDEKKNSLPRNKINIPNKTDAIFEIPLALTAFITFLFSYRPQGLVKLSSGDIVCYRNL